ncbi:MAG: hypothetical protein ACFFCW_28520 [Candidatus Hodarchaeota archaeon]
MSKWQKIHFLFIVFSFILYLKTPIPLQRERIVYKISLDQAEYVHGGIKGILLRTWADEGKIITLDIMGSTVFVPFENIIFFYEQR